MTKKGTPHLHLVVGGIGERIDFCEKGRKKFEWSLDWANRDCVVDCLTHEWAKIWWDNTGAFVVDVRKVYDVGGISGYLSKYLAKGFLSREALQALGFERRWSCSRNWPREQQIQLRGTAEGAWDTIDILPRYFQRRRMEFLERRYASSPLLERVGDDLGLLLRERVQVRVGISKIERMLKHVKGIPEDARAPVVHGG